METRRSAGPTGGVLYRPKPASLLALCAAAWVALATPAASAPAPSFADSARQRQRSADQDGWAKWAPSVTADIRSGHPLVIRVVVPLCSNEQIWCGAGFAGQPGKPATNLYWGAIFGARRFFERKRSVWSRVELSSGDGVVLERAVYRRTVPASHWDLNRTEPVEQIAVLEAIHGARIDDAVQRFWHAATRGGEISFQDAGQQRTFRVHVMGYVGHNRLMDGIPFPPQSPAVSQPARPVPSFVLACNSEGYFTRPLTSAGSMPLLMTRTLMAPEGYVVDAVLRGLGENDSPAELRRRAIRAYAAWQRIPERQAGGVFAKR
jgi:hypothetical protein